jgi:hypothetical protein
MATTAVLKASGLQTSPNELNREEGALIEASNVIIRRDNIIEQRRGFPLFGSDLPSSSDRVKQLTSYYGRILRHYSNKLQYDFNGKGAFQDFLGTYLETQTGLRMKFIESNGNFYFTTSDGIKKISARGPQDFSSSDAIYSAGAVKAVDFTTETVYTPNAQAGFLPQDGAVSYRVVWGYKDVNTNLVLGSPSQRVVASNPMIDLLIRDYTRLLTTVDNFSNTPLTAARINDKNYFQTLGLTLNASASDLYTNLIALAAKLDNDIFFADQALVAPLQINTASVSANIVTVNFSSGTATDYFVPGSLILLEGGWVHSGVDSVSGAHTVVSVGATSITFNATAPNGAITLTSPTIKSNEYRSITAPSVPSSPATNAQLVEQQDYLENIILRLTDELDAVVSASDKTSLDSVDITTTATVDISITIPDGIDTKYFFQVYRSAVAQATGAASFDDVVPNDELQQVYEAYPTAAELAAGFVEFTDVTPDDFRGTNLYTNASTGEGILQANDIPPVAKDITRYRNSTFYANTRTFHRLFLNLLGVTQMIEDYDNAITPKITISNGDVTNTYSFVVGQQEITEIVTVADVANSLNSKYFLIDSVSSKFYVYFETTTAIDPAIPGRTGIKVRVATGATANTVAQTLRNSLAAQLDDFIADVSTNTVTVTCFDVGITEDAQDIDTGFTISATQQGVSERVQPEITDITTVAGSLYTSSGTADYFTLNLPFDQNRFYFYFAAGTATDPALAGYSGIEVPITGTETAAQVATLVAGLIPDQFTTSVLSNVITATAVQYGQVTAPIDSVANIGFDIVVTQPGALEVLLSPLVSPARAVDATARSFIRVINKNPGETVYGQYLSSAFDVPGKMLLEARSLLSSDPFYVLGNNANTGASFSPDIGPQGTVTAIAAGNPAVITTSAAHGLITGDTVVLNSTNSAPSVDGAYVITYLSPTTFSIDRTVTTPGTSGAFISGANSLFSENETRPNRVYFSKFLQPDAVPIANFFDVGATDMEILRILPLRDSLFVFKEDGLFRISGETVPFQLELFDSSFITLAPDSVAVANNVIYAWTTQGIQSLTEGGSTIISRQIDNIILKIQSSNFTNFKTATWGIGYESDNSYIVSTVTQTDDEFATIAYRYSTLTNTWTTYDISCIAGVVNNANDKLYLAPSDKPNIAQERKSFDRTDYADREFATIVANAVVLQNTIVLPSVTDFKVGDAFVQEQTITVYNFNALLDKLDFDTGPADNNYSNLAITAGSNPRSALVSLAQKLDADANIAFTTYESSIANKTGTISVNSQTNPTVITSAAHGLLTGRVVLIDSSNSTPSINGTYTVTVIDANRFSIDASVLVAGSTGNWQTVVGNFQDLKTCYNQITTLLNSDTGVSFANYSQITGSTIQEAIITDINGVTKRITLNQTLDFLVGDATVYEAIVTKIVYSPVTMGDPVMYKHLREATVMFEARNITSGKLSFATDLLPEFKTVPFNLDGNGIFGHSNAFGNGFFGGIASAAPFRTYIPRQCMRCRYIVVKFEHATAREDYKITGMTLTGEVGQSTRAYR